MKNNAISPFKACFGFRVRQQGLAIVEFTLILPFMLLWLFAIAEVGRALYEYNTLLKAVEAGARELVLNEDQSYAQNLVVFGNIAGSGSPLLDGLTIDMVDFPAPPLADTVKISVAYPFQTLPGDPLSGLMGLFSASGSFSPTLLASATMGKL